MKECLTKKERILNALKNRETDRIPWAPLIDNYFISSLPNQGYNMNIIEAMRYIDCEIIERHIANPIEKLKNVQVRQDKSNNGSERIYYETPVGTIYSEWSVSGKTNFLTKHMVETIEDIKVYQYIVENTTYEENIKKLVERNKYIGDDGIATPSGNMTPIQYLLQFICGIQNTVYLQMDYPKEMDDLLNAMHEMNKRQYKVLVDYPTEVVFAYEDTSSTVMSKDMFIEYSMPQINDYAKIMQDCGKVFITHMCGKLSAFADEIGKGSQNGIDSVCPPTTGDLPIWEARKIWGDNKVIIGGIEPPSLVWMTEQESIKVVEEILEKLPSKKGIILSTGDAVPHDTPIGNLIAINKLIKEKGYY